MNRFGSKFTKIEMKIFYADYRGIIATQDIYKGEEIVFVPKDCMITLSMAKQAKIGKILVEKGVSLIYPNNSFLSTYVISEIKDPNTKWKLLFEALPKTVDNFPIFFKEQEKLILKGSDFLTQIQDLKNDMEKDYKKISEAVPEFTTLATLEEFMRTRSLVNSRIFGTKIDGNDDDSIVPIAGIYI